MPPVRVILLDIMGLENVLELIDFMAIESMPFEFAPLPDGIYRLIFKHEYSLRVERKMMECHIHPVQRAEGTENKW